jgi:hypothetical protein
MACPDCRLPLAIPDRFDVLYAPLTARLMEQAEQAVLHRWHRQFLDTAG